MRSSASSAIGVSAAKIPAAIHSSRRPRIVVAEHVVSAMPCYEQPNRKTCRSLPNTIRSLILRRWHRNGGAGSNSARPGNSAANWSHNGSVSHDGKAGTGPPDDHEAFSNFMITKPVPVPKSRHPHHHTGTYSRSH
jgi:hypothetical protein